MYLHKIGDHSDPCYLKSRSYSTNKKYHLKARKTLTTYTCTISHRDIMYLGNSFPDFGGKMCLLNPKKAPPPPLIFHSIVVYETSKSVLQNITKKTGGRRSLFLAYPKFCPHTVISRQNAK